MGKKTNGFWTGFSCRYGKECGGLALNSGSGPLFSNPDCDVARERFGHKSKGMGDKRRPVADAVRELIDDGDYLATGGFGGNRIATAVIHEIVRQKKQGLGLAGHTTTHDFQVLCSGNLTDRGQLLNRVDAAYIIGLEARGLSPHARRVMESGEVKICEWTNYTLALRFQAASMGVPFLPVRSVAGTDTFQHSAARAVECPFTGQLLTAVPALFPDVAAIHVHQADRYGNCRIRGTSVSDWFVARAAHKVIVTCEELVEEDVIREDPTSTVIPFYCVDAVCEVPGGSYPGNMPYAYFSDEEHLRAWLDAEREPGSHQQWLSKYVFETASFDEYLEKCGGRKRLQELRQEELLDA